MAHYLFQASYTPEAWGNLIRDPQNRLEAVAPVIEELGGRFIDGWLAFGDYDVVAICEAPDNVSQAAFAMAAHASGHLSAVKTTPLMTVEDGIRAMEKAGAAAYPAPGS